MFQVNELRNHITQHKATNVVSISEDATRVISRVDYDSETDRRVEFVLHVDQNGLPLVDSFVAVSFTAIKVMFQNSPISKYAYMYIAQPLGKNVPLFCLACMGTNNKFDAEHVLVRWKFICDRICKKGSSTHIK